MSTPGDPALFRPVAYLVGAARLVVAAGLVVAGTVAILASSRGPGRGGPERVAGALSRALLWTAGVRRDTVDADVLRQHRGFVFFNHLSYLDPLVLAAAAPMRFLATAGVRRLPLIGWVATALGTVYVSRSDGASRAATREALREAVSGAPLPFALAPEGRIGPGPAVLPLRHGAFEVAADAGAPVRLVAITFEPMADVRWHQGESLLAACWRLCARLRPVTARLVVLGALGPAERTDAARQAALAARVLNRQLTGAASV